ncbi:hypothetical protein BpHYR1_021508 [Brachionus plicatilis]|uniref:Uncharacterized protein n=1 Tax=Brachionus plicatilis TaxID=10195 RepID=A0A3M7Q057_BRAPC|nr:hypothetical protein BpHYR1_021508 [Brachionus plicatilis]
MELSKGLNFKYTYGQIMKLILFLKHGMSDKQKSIIPNFIINGNNSASETSEISKLLNHFFTDII